MQTSDTKKALLLALMLVAGSASAEWVSVGGSDTANYYIDPATIRKDGNLRKVWIIQDLKQRDKGGQMSRRSRVEYDCKGERFRILAFSTHSEPMAGGTTLATHELEKPDPWREIPPGNLSEDVLKTVCAQ